MSRRCNYPGPCTSRASLIPCASKSISTSSRENSLALIDTTVIRHVLLQPRKAGECHLNFAEGCHLYIASTAEIRGRLFMKPGTKPPRARAAGFSIGPQRRLQKKLVEIDCALQV